MSHRFLPQGNKPADSKLTYGSERYGEGARGGLRGTACDNRGLYLTRTLQEAAVAEGQSCRRGTCVGGAAGHLEVLGGAHSINERPSAASNTWQGSRHRSDVAIQHVLAGRSLFTAGCVSDSKQKGVGSSTSVGSKNQFQAQPVSSVSRSDSEPAHLQFGRVDSRHVV
jgi:hypothetical protein